MGVDENNNIKSTFDWSDIVEENINFKLKMYFIDLQVAKIQILNLTCISVLIKYIYCV